MEPAIGALKVAAIPPAAPQATRLRTRSSDSLNACPTIDPSAEPIWAIGTGETASPSQAQEMHKHIRDVLTEVFDEEIAQNIRILYGGSVKPENIKELMKEDDINGALVGGASLDPKSFAEIVKF